MTQVVSVFVWVSLYLPLSVSLSCMCKRLPAGKFHPGSHYQHLLHHIFQIMRIEFLSVGDAMRLSLHLSLSVSVHLSLSVHNSQSGRQIV